MQLADLWFSRYIRIKYHYKIQNGDVFCQCIVSPAIIKLAQNMDNGHLFSRKFMSLRYHEFNCRPQNRSSNRFSGESDHYTFKENLKKQIGADRVNELETIRNQEVNADYDFFIQKAAKFKKLTNELIADLRINKWW